jgi:hypothetical protein
MLHKAYREIPAMRENSAEASQHSLSIHFVLIRKIGKIETVGLVK